MNSNAVTFAEGVYDSNIIGCVFTDIGSSAFILGRWYIRDGRAVDPDPERAANVVFRKGWIASHDWTTGYASAMSVILFILMLSMRKIIAKLLARTGE